MSVSWGIFLPIILIGIVIIVVVASLKLKTILPSISNIRLNWIVTLYIIILLGAVILFYILSAQYADVDNSNHLTDDEYDEMYQEFYEAIIDKEFEESDYVVKMKEWTFDYTVSDEALRIGLADPHNLAFVIIEYKDVEDDKVDVIHYTTPTIVAGKDVTHLILSPDVSLSGNQLVISNPPYYEVKIASLAKEFTIRQFMADENKPNDVFPWRGFGHDDILFVRLPKNVQFVEDTNVDIEVIE